MRFNQENIVLNASFDDKWQAIHTCGQLLSSLGYVEEGYVQAMKEREKVATAYIGNSVAIPHGIAGSEQLILESGIVIFQIPQGVLFGDDLCKIMIGIAGKDNKHIELLCKISNVLIVEGNIQALIDASDKSDVASIILGE